MKPPYFKPAWWLPGAHLQTLWPAFFRNRVVIPLRRERVELADGDFIDLDWSGESKEPLVLILHGLEGSVDSHYIRPLMSSLNQSGFATVLMHFRGCSGESNRLARSYHSGDTGDIINIVNHIISVHGRNIIAAVGFSLGGNALLKWLGQSGKTNPLTSAVAISVPFVLSKATDHLSNGFSRLYQFYLLRSLRKSYLKKFSMIKSPLSVDVSKLTNLREFDDQITAPLHGYSGAEQYYRESSCRQYLKHIEIPTCIIHSRDDPFMYASTIPNDDELSDKVELILTNNGGHLGFVSGRLPWKAHYWHEDVILEFLSTTEL